MTEGPGRARGQSDYYYRRPLEAAEMIPAMAIGLGAGLVAFYLTRLLTQRTPLIREETLPVVGAGEGVVRRPRRLAGG